MSCKANRLWLAVSAGLLNVSLKGPFRAADGKTNLEFQCWPGEDGSSQLG